MQYVHVAEYECDGSLLNFEMFYVAVVVIVYVHSLYHVDLLIVELIIVFVNLKNIVDFLIDVICRLNNSNSKNNILFKNFFLLIDRFVKEKPISLQIIALGNIDDDTHYLSSQISEVVNDLDSFTIHVFYRLLNNQLDQ
jgi:hypothetical protein